MAILIEIKKEGLKKEGLKKEAFTPKTVGTIDTSIPGAQEIAVAIANGYNQLFSDTSSLTLYNQIIYALIKQIQTHEQLRCEKEKRGIK